MKALGVGKHRGWCCDGVDKREHRYAICRREPWDWWKYKNPPEGHFGEAVEAKTDGAVNEGRSCRSTSFCRAKEVFLLLRCLRINMKLQGCGEGWIIWNLRGGVPYKVWAGPGSPRGGDSCRITGKTAGQREGSWGLGTRAGFLLLACLKWSYLAVRHLFAVPIC